MGRVKGKRRGWKWLLLSLVLLVVVMAVMALTYAYWLPHAARPVAKRYGVTFEGYQRLDDGRFALTNVVRTNRLFDLKISQLEGFLPHVWRSKAQDGTNETANFVQVNGWRVEVHDRNTAPDELDRSVDRPKRRLSVYEHWKRVEDVIAQLREWVPKATLLNGIIEYDGKEYAFSVITWDRGVLDGTGVWPISAVPIDIKGRFTGKPPYQLSYAMHPLDLRARLRVTETNDLLNTQLAFFYKENRADLTANFGRHGLLPLTATVKAPDFKLPGSTLKLKDYSEITGSFSAEWKTNQYAAELKAHAEPAGDTALPPGDVDLVASGDTNSVRIERAVSTIPGLQLTVSDPIELSYRGRMLSERAEITVDAELERIPGVKLDGRVQGTILLERSEEYPKATFRAAGRDVSGFKLKAESIDLQGRFDWPRLESFEGRVRFATNSAISIIGSADLQSRQLGATVVKAEGPMPQDVFPPSMQFDHLSLTAKVAGGVTNLQHEVEVEVREFDAPQIEPLTIEATWKARLFTFDDLAIRARAGPATVFVSGSGYAGGGRTNFVVRDLSFFKGDEPYLALAETARITFSTNAAGTQLEMAPMRLAGTNRELNISGGLVWPQLALLDLRATNVNPSLFQPFFTRSLGGLDLQDLNVNAGWSNGPVTGLIVGRFSTEVEDFEKLTASLDLKLQPNGIQLSRVSVSNSAAAILHAAGFVPLSIHPLEEKKVFISPNEEIEIEAETSGNEAFWNTVGRFTKLDISNASVRLSVQGTTEKPTGELNFKGAALSLAQTNRNLPSVGEFEGRVLLDEQKLTVPIINVRVEDQPVNIAGSIMLGDNFWTQRREDILPYVIQNAELEFEAPEVNLAAFAAYLPEQLRPQGKLIADIAMHRGQQFDGAIQLQGVETRPLPRLGVVQDIKADVKLRGRKLAFENISAVLGGETLSVGGTIDFSDESLAKNYPDLALTIAGFNLPLARNPDVILRSDLNLQVRNGTNGIPVISGTANLRDSFLLRDIATLVPGRVTRPERRPPYFSVPQDPMDEWLLDVRVRGDNFMRVRSPFFQGQVSANFHVSGNLEEPVSLGEAAITSGNVIFPFATLAVKQALVSLTIENPYLPDLFVVASGRAFGFDVRMQVEGPADEPVIEFSSVPSLTSEQIILMLTTGQIPRQDFGFSTEDRASKLAFFLGKSLWAKMNPNANAEERLTIRSGQDVTEQGRQTYEVEYKLNERWSLLGEYNRFGDLNANVKWRVFSR